MTVDDFLVGVLLFFTSAFAGWVLLRHVSIAGRMINFTPMAFYLLGYVVLVFLPHACFYFLPKVESPYVTLERGETFFAVVSACLCLLGWCSVIFMVKREWFPWLNASLSAHENAAHRNTDLVVQAVVFTAVALVLNMLLFGTEKSSAWLALKGIAAGDLRMFFEDYNSVRYQATKEAVIERGIRGMGTLTIIMEFSSYIAFFLITMLAKTRGKFWWILSAFAMGLAVYISFVTGMRSKILYFMVYAYCIAATLFRLNGSLRTVFWIGTVLGLLVLYTSFTPKSFSEGGLSGVLTRFSRNAVNDAVIIGLQTEGIHDFGPLNPFARDYVPIDRQLNLLLTSRENSPWYETATCLASYYVLGGLPGVFVSGILTGILCLVLTHVIRLIAWPVFKAALFPIIGIVLMALPITGWLAPAALLGCLAIMGIYSLNIVLASLFPKIPCAREMSAGSNETASSENPKVMSPDSNPVSAKAVLTIAKAGKRGDSLHCGYLPQPTFPGPVHS